MNWNNRCYRRGRGYTVNVYRVKDLWWQSGLYLDVPEDQKIYKVTKQEESENLYIYNSKGFESGSWEEGTVKDKR